MALLAISCIGEFSVYSILQVYLVQDAHFSPAGANVAIAAARILTPAAVVIGGVVADRKNPYVVLAGGLVLHALALALMCLPSDFSALTGMGLQAFSIALLFPSLFKAMALSFPADRQALVMSLTMPLASPPVWPPCFWAGAAKSGVFAQDSPPSAPPPCSACWPCACCPASGRLRKKTDVPRFHLSPSPPCPMPLPFPFGTFLLAPAFTFPT